MTALGALFLPILVSAVLVFIVSAVIHMAPLWHRNDLPQVPDEEGVRKALAPYPIPPGEYMVPRAGSMEGMKSPEFIEKTKRGPNLIITSLPPGPFGMGRPLALWFVYVLLVSILAAYVAGAALPAGAEYLSVFRFAGVTAFIGYAVALWQQSIWYHRSWGQTAKITFDGLIYGLITGGAFGWLWP